MILKPTHGRTSRRSLRRGFTLVELMIAMALGVVALSMAASFVIRASRVMYDSSKRLELNSKVRQFTGRFAKETIDANSFFILQKYTGLDGEVDLIGADPDSDPLNKPVAPGASGDCMILEYRDNPNNRSAITRLRIYYRDTTQVDDPAPIRYIDVAVPTAHQTASINFILNTYVGDLPSTHANHPPLVSYQVHGIIPSDETEVQPIFFNHNGRAVAVNFRMQTAGTDSGPPKRSASAYNFTISPRR